MDVREKLVDLLCEAQHIVTNTNKAEYLIAHGVTVQADCKACAEATQNCIVKLQEQIAELRSVQEWIPVAERLPEECPHPYDDMTKAVLIYTPVDGYTHVGWYAGKDYRGRDVWKTLSAMRSYQTCTKKVSHWCHLPQPPKGE